MVPYLLIFNGIAAAVCAVFCIVSGFDVRLFCGLVTGNALMLANFLLIGLTADKVVKCRDFRRGRFIANLSYGLRYVGIFAVLAILLTLDAVALIPAVVPLFYPKLYYTFFYLRSNKSNSDEEEQKL